MNERDKELAKRDIILAMGREAGICKWLRPSADVVERLEHFATLIRADEREALIRYFDGHWRDEWSEGQIIEALEARGNT